MAHELSELGYGLSGVSTGSEPHRCITLYKNSSSGLPLKTLSETVSSMMREEVAMACSTQTQEQNALTLTFTGWLGLGCSSSTYNLHPCIPDRMHSDRLESGDRLELFSP